MKLHVKEGVFVDRDESGNVALEVIGDLGPVRFTADEWAKLTIAGAALQDETSMAIAKDLQAFGRVVHKTPDRRVLTLNLQFAVEATDDNPLYDRVSDALHAFAEHNRTKEGPGKTMVTVNGVNFRVDYRNDYYSQGVLMDTSSNGQRDG